MARFAVLLATLVACVDAFAPVARPLAVRAATSAVSMMPVDIDVASSLDVVSSLPTQLVSLEVRSLVDAWHDWSCGCGEEAPASRRQPS